MSTDKPVYDDVPLENTIADGADNCATEHEDSPDNNNADSQNKPQSFINSSLRSFPMGIKVIIGFALVSLACMGIYKLQSFIAPAFLAFTLVLTVLPIQRALVRRRVPRWLASTISIIVLISVLSAVIWLLVWSMAGLPDLLASYSDRVESMVNSLLEFAEKRGFSTDDIQEKITGSLSVSSIMSALTSIMSSVTSAGSASIIIAISVIFLTIDMNNMTERSTLVKSRDSGLFSALAAFEGRVRQYWLVSSVFGLIVAIIDGIALVILDVPLPIAWVMLSFITNYIPNIGFVLGLLPPALLALVDQGPWTALWVVVAYSVINVVIQSFIQPKITGDAVGLTPTTTFISLLFWAIIVGPLGTILAVPLTLFAKAILVDASPQTRWLDAFLVPDSEVRKKKEQGFYDEESPAPDVFADLTQATFHIGRISDLLSNHASEEADGDKEDSPPSQRQE